MHNDFFFVNIAKLRISHLQSSNIPLKLMIPVTNKSAYYAGPVVPERRDLETSSRLIPLVNELTHILIEAGKNKLQ